MTNDQRTQMATGAGFIAALDQSGGSTPKALRDYGIADSSYSGETEMFDLMHAMRSRIVTSPAFGGDRIIAAILFEQTMDRTIEGRESATYLWEHKHVVPILKVDKGLADEADGVQLMKPIPGLDDLLARARAKGVFGTKMRSVIHDDSATGVDAILDQQFEIAAQISAAGLVPIIEPEVSITSPHKEHAEELLAAGIQKRLDALGPAQDLMLKITIPTVDNLYAPIMDHPRMLRVVALSGGYSRDEACALLKRNDGLIASFSRALTEGLSAQQSDDEFNATLEASIAEIYAASVTKG
jgi:fructose-bisphosphate aldolase class I